MALSSGNKTALGEAASWLFAGGCLVISVVYFDELKSIISPLPQGQQIAASRDFQSDGGRINALRQQAQPNLHAAGNVVELSAEQSGHFETTAYVNGRATNVLVDTGATYVGLTYEDAEGAGIYVDASDFKYKVQTANGDTRIAIVNIDKITIGGIEVRNVKASVGQPGKLHVTLLGMSFLSKLRRAEMRSGRLILEN